MLNQQSTDFRDPQMLLMAKTANYHSVDGISELRSGAPLALVLDVDMPSYLSGLVGGMTALPGWELLKWRSTTKPATR
jgi:hypothetical protein